MNKPLVTEGPGCVKCLLPRRSIERTIEGTMRQLPIQSNLHEQKLMRLFLIAEEIRASDVIRTLSVSRSTATRLLDKLVKHGILIKSGRGAQTRYKRYNSEHL